MLAVAGVALAAFAIFEMAKSSSPNSTQQKQYEEKPAQVNDDSSVGTGEDAKQDANYGAGTKKNEKGYMRRFLEFVEIYEKAIVAISTIFIALFTVTLGLATIFLSRATRDLVRGAENTAKRQLRAYVSVANAEVRKFGTSEPLQAYLLVKNSGQTPAYKLMNQIAIAVAKFPLSKFPDYGEWKPSSGFLGPSETIWASIAAPRALTAEEQAKIASGELTIYVSFEVRYRDTFGKVEHFAQFRGFYRGNGVAPGTGTVLELEQTVEGNEGD